MKICTIMKEFPGDMMIIPLLIGCLVNTFIPQVLEIGGFTTGLFKTGTSTLVGLLTLCSGAAINFKQVALLLYKGAVLTTLKYAIGVLLGLGPSRLFGSIGILGLIPLAVITAVTDSNGAIYTALAKEFGDNTDVGTITILSLNNGPSLTMTALDTTGPAEIPALSLVAAIVPLIIGVILDNLDEDFKVLLSSESAMLLPFNGSMLGANTSLFTIAKAGAGGIILGLIIVLFTGVLIYYLYGLIQGKPDPVRMAVGTIGGNAVAVPASVAMAGPPLEPVVGVAAAQVAGAVVITTTLTPILTGFLAKRVAKRQQKN